MGDRRSSRRRSSSYRAKRSTSLTFEMLEQRALMAGDFTLQILHASDAEAGLAAIDDAPRFAAIIDALEDTHQNSILVSGGDNYLPGAFFNASGDPALNAVLGGAGTASIGRGDIEIMNRIGFEVSAMGNHEFDLGTRELRTLFQPSGAWQGGLFPYLTANVNFANDPELNNRLSSGGQEASSIKGRIAPSAIIIENGEKIGIIGLTTPEILTVSSPGSNVVITPGSGTYDLPAIANVINDTVSSLQAQGVNKIVLLSHLQQFTNEVNLAPFLNGVDVIVASGSNTISADSGDRLRTGDAIEAQYPLVTSGADGNPTLIVSTDGGYRYVGRTVVTFDSAGVLNPASIDPAVSGAFATDDQGVLDVYNSLGLDPTTALTTGKGSSVKQVTDVIDGVLQVKDSSLFGRTSVFLEGRRAAVRTQETNFGNLTADANLYAARQMTGDATIGISLKNGGGIRDSIGSLGDDGTLLPTVANPDAGKAAGDISQLDIENSLRFNNGLSVVSLSGSELAQLLEWGFADSRTGNTPGRFPQIGGMTVEVDLSKPAGDRLRNLSATDTSGAQIVVVQNGALVAPAAQFRMVTLGFLADGGDGYPFSTLATPNRVNLAAGTGNDFATQGSEQKALADYLVANFPIGGSSAFGQPETAPRQDQRISLFPAPDNAVSLSPLSTVSVPGGAEISAYDPASQQLYVTKNNGGVPSLDIIDISQPASPVVVANVSLAAFGGSISSVSVKDGVVAAAMIANPKTSPGKVVFLNTDGEVLGSVAVGAVPDMLTFTPDGAKLLVAIEGEAAENMTPEVNNPEGGVSIITLDKSNIGGGSLNSSTVQFAGFSAFNAQKQALRDSGVRLLANPGVTVAMDLEPEYIALAADGLTARVTLQEANAFGILDLNSATFTAIQPLRLKDHSLVGNELDASDRDGAGTGGSSQRISGNFQNWPVFGVYMPDAIASFQAGGQTYYVTANEGDARPNAADTADTDVGRVGSLDLDDTLFPNEAFLKHEDNLGRLNVLLDGDTDGDGDIDQLRTLGGRSFTIWDSAGNKVFDSGSELERLTLELTPTMFNANDGVSSAVDQRSDDKGPEPEGVTTGIINGRTYAFVGLERSAGGVMVYDVTNPKNPTFVQYAFRNDLDTSTAGDDVSPEGLVFISAADSPSGIPLLVVSNEVSGTVTIYQITPSPVINEFVLDHAGADTHEFVEVLAAPGADLSNLTLLQIEGDNTGAQAGLIKSAHALTAADAAGYWTTGFLADVFESGSSTLLLVQNFTGTVGNDLDTNNDGVLDSAPWQTVVDAVAVNDGGSGDRAYATYSLAGSLASGASRIPNGAADAGAANWRVNDFDGAGLPTFTGTPVIGEAYNTPGVANALVVPLAPVVEAGPAQSVTEGDLVTLAGSFIDTDSPSGQTILWQVAADNGQVIVEGNSLAFSFTPVDNGTYTLTLTVTDQGGLAASDTVVVTVLNANPVITNFASNAANGQVAAGQAISVSGSFTDAGVADTHTAVIDWGDGTSSLASVHQLNRNFAAQHTYAQAGVYEVSVAIQDDDHGTDSADTRALAEGVRVQAGVLTVVGTSKDDQVTINRQGNQSFRVQLGNKLQTVPASGVQSILVVLGAGDDTATIASNINLPAIIDGGNGVDVLSSGGGPSVLLGGGGLDLLAGGNGRNILIGGDQSDLLHGASGEDLLIGGSTVYDLDYSALREILNVWNSSGSYASRVAALESNYLEAGVSVLDDFDLDLMAGAAGRDWFFAGLDLIVDRKSNENRN